MTYYLLKLLNFKCNYNKNNNNNTDGLPGNDQRELQGRFEWTDELRDDLLLCYDSSEPARRGYMARMHALWCVKCYKLPSEYKHYLLEININI